MGIMITYHGYNNGHNNPMYNVYKNGGAHYTRQNMVNLRWVCAAHPGLFAEVVGTGLAAGQQLCTLSSGAGASTAGQHGCARQPATWAFTPWVGATNQVMIPTY